MQRTIMVRKKKETASVVSNKKIDNRKAFIAEPLAVHRGHDDVHRFGVLTLVVVCNGLLWTFL